MTFFPRENTTTAPLIPCTFQRHTKVSVKTARQVPILFQSNLIINSIIITIKIYFEVNTVGGWCIDMVSKSGRRSKGLHSSETERSQMSQNSDLLWDLCTTSKIIFWRYDTDGIREQKLKTVDFLDFLHLGFQSLT